MLRSWPSRNIRATVPALRGVTAYTAEWIFTPAGMPSAVTRRAYGAVDVPGGSVAAGEQQQVHAHLLHLARGLLRVLRGRPAAGYRPDHRGLKAALPRLVLAHLGGVRDNLDAVLDLGQRLERVHRSERRLGNGAQLPGAPLDVRAVAAFQADPATHAGHRIDYYAELFHCCG